ncbi:hypothetical protein NC653_037534 [Populus alba x Populus x berolinensis]|uniref:Wall-associated receptor kinase galacturonan-binding domain-containing protein n=1 Tax=Populus alba x Populus x berolinensis TaxID=444605 RepID=A0AAD6PTS6_9ROSI|nr:hypothetical protein NC653_037534 [Populus alba x Populus x berolinensis]
MGPHAKFRVGELQSRVTSSSLITKIYMDRFVHGHGASLNCTGSCGNRGPDIRFPFRIKDKQPDHCGYPGYDLLA